MSTLPSRPGILGRGRSVGSKAIYGISIGGDCDKYLCSSYADSGRVGFAHRITRQKEDDTNVFQELERRVQDRREAFAHKPENSATNWPRWELFLRRGRFTHRTPSWRRIGKMRTKIQQTANCQRSNCFTLGDHPFVCKFVASCLPEPEPPAMQNVGNKTRIPAAQRRPA